MTVLTYFQFPKAPPDRIKFLLGLGNLYRRYFCVWIGPARVTIVVNHTETVKAVMRTSREYPACLRVYVAVSPCLRMCVCVCVRPVYVLFNF